MAATLFRPKKTTTSLVPCLMAGDETARLAHALDAHVYNFFEVLVFQQLAVTVRVPLFHYFMSCVMVLFPFYYLSTLTFC